MALGAHFTPFLCQLSVLRVFKAKATQIRRKSKQTLEAPRIEPGTSSSEGRALTNGATPAPVHTSEISMSSSHVLPLKTGYENNNNAHVRLTAHFHDITAAMLA